MRVAQEGSRHDVELRAVLLRYTMRCRAWATRISGNHSRSEARTSLLCRPVRYQRRRCIFEVFRVRAVRGGAGVPESQDGQDAGLDRHLGGYCRPSDDRLCCGRCHLGGDPGGDGQRSEPTRVSQEVLSCPEVAEPSHVTGVRVWSDLGCGKIDCHHVFFMSLLSCRSLCLCYCDCHSIRSLSLIFAVDVIVIHRDCHCHFHCRRHCHCHCHLVSSLSSSLDSLTQKRTSPQFAVTHSNSARLGTKRDDPLSTLFFNALLQSKKNVISKVEQRRSRSQAHRTRSWQEPLQAQVSGCHPPHQRLTQTLNDHVRRPHHSHDTTSKCYRQTRQSNILDSAWNQAMDLQTAQSTLEPSRDDCQAPQRPVDKTHYAVEHSDLDQPEDIPKAWTTTGGRHYPQPAKVRNEDHDLMHDMTWLTTGQGNERWNSMESDSPSSKQTNHQGPRL